MTPPPRGRRGSVLILVTWTIASLSVLAAVLGARSLFALSFAQRMERQLQSRSLVWAGVERALSALETDTTPDIDGLADDWRNSPERFQFALGRGEVKLSYPAIDTASGRRAENYGFLDEERKLPLNTAPRLALMNLFLQLPGITEEEATVIVDSIEDWRDADKEKKDYGAENFYYLGLEPPYECKDGPFENVEELLFVRGVTPELYEQAAPYLTARGKKVNLNTADPRVLRLLGLSEAGVNGIVFYRAGEDNIEGTADDRALAAVSAASTELQTHCPQEDLNRLAQLDAQQLLSVSSKIFELLLTARVDDDPGSETRVRALMDREGRVLAWAE